MVHNIFCDSKTDFQSFLNLPNDKVSGSVNQLIDLIETCLRSEYIH